MILSNVIAKAVEIPIFEWGIDGIIDGLKSILILIVLIQIKVWFSNLIEGNR